MGLIWTHIQPRRMIGTTFLIENTAQIISVNGDQNNFNHSIQTKKFKNLCFRCLFFFTKQLTMSTQIGIRGAPPFELTPLSIMTNQPSEQWKGHSTTNIIIYMLQGSRDHIPLYASAAIF